MSKFFLRLAPFSFPTKSQISSRFVLFEGRGNATANLLPRCLLLIHVITNRSSCCKILINDFNRLSIFLIIRRLAISFFHVGSGEFIDCNFLLTTGDYRICIKCEGFATVSHLLIHWSNRQAFMIVCESYVLLIIDVARSWQIDRRCCPECRDLGEGTFIQGTNFPKLNFGDADSSSRQMFQKPLTYLSTVFELVD